MIIRVKDGRSTRDAGGIFSAMDFGSSIPAACRSRMALRAGSVQTTARQCLRIEMEESMSATRNISIYANSAQRDFHFVRVLIGILKSIIPERGSRDLAFVKRDVVRLSTRHRHSQESYAQSRLVISS